MKQFTKFNTQILKLREKNLIVKDGYKAKRALEKDNYFSLINGYKDFFCASTSPSFKFISGTKFEHIKALFDLDRELRNIYLKKLLKIEKNIKTMSAYYFCEENTKNNRAYLDFRSFDYTYKSNKSVHEVISVLSKKLANKHDKVITHFLNEHQEVPMWILINTLTAGELYYFFIFLKPNQKKSVATYFTVQQKRDYKNYKVVTEKDVERYLENAKYYRNVCAHEERFYCYSTKDYSNLYYFHESMKKFLSKKDVSILENSLKNLFDRYSKKFVDCPKDINDIKNKCGLNHL